jgi:Icc protein
MTDLHVVGREQLCQGRVPTNAQLREAVAHINGLEPRPDIVLATDDLTDHGTAGRGSRRHAAGTAFIS